MVKKQTFIDNHLAEIHDYIIDKILALDVKLVKITAYEVYLLVDGTNEIGIWIANGVKNCSIHMIDGRVFDKFPIPLKIKKKIWSKIAPYRFNAEELRKLEKKFTYK